MIFRCYLLLDVSLHANGVNYSESSLKICEPNTPPLLAFKKIGSLRLHVSTAVPV